MSKNRLCVKFNEKANLRFSQVGFQRRGRDSNPRWSFPHTAFPVLHLRPLGHLSGHGGYRLSLTLASEGRTSRKMAASWSLTARCHGDTLRQGRVHRSEEHT